MSGHPIVNLLELENFMEGRVEGLDGRFRREAMRSRDLGVSYWHYAPGLRLGSHAHRTEEEAYIVVSGSGRVLLDGEPRDLRRWDAFTVPPNVPRAFEAGPDGLEMIVVGGPNEGTNDMRGEVYWPEVDWPD